MSGASTTIAKASQAITASPERVLWVFSALHTLAFSAIALFAQPNLPLDVIEQLAWARDPQLAYYKHPPLAAWLLDAIGSYRLATPWPAAIVGPALSALTFVIVWKVARRVLTPLRALAASTALEGMIYFNYRTLEFNQDLIQLPLWAAIAYFAHRCYRERMIADWISLGILSALGLYAKYSTLLLLFCLLLAFLQKPARNTFLTPGPWISFGVSLLLLSPHLIALDRIDYAPFHYALDRTDYAGGAFDHLFFPLAFLGAQIVNCAVALLLMAILICPRNGPVMVPPEQADGNDRLFFLIVGLGPLTISLIAQLILGVRFRDMWGTPMFDFLPLTLLLFASERPISANAYAQYVFAVGCTFLAVIVARLAGNIFAPYAEPHQIDRLHYPGREIARVLTTGWHEKAGECPLALVAASSWSGGNVTVYSKEHPHLLINGDFSKSPWVTPDDVSARGILIVWPKSRAVEDQELLEKFPTAYRQPDIMFTAAGSVAKTLQVSWAIVMPKRSSCRASK